MKKRDIIFTPEGLLKIIYLHRVVRSVYFSSSVLVSLLQKFGIDSLKGLKQQTNYSSVQLKQTDLS